MRKKTILVILLIVALLCANFLVACRQPQEEVMELPAKTQEVEKNKEEGLAFPSNSVLAVGYIAPGEEQAFMERYFTDGKTLTTLPTIHAGDANTFVLLPKDRSTTITVWEAVLEENGTIKPGRTLGIVSDSGLVLRTGETEVVPAAIVAYESGNHTFTFPLQFSGENGKLTFGDGAPFITDISIYD